MNEQYKDLGYALRITKNGVSGIYGVYNYHSQDYQGYKHLQLRKSPKARKG